MAGHTANQADSDGVITLEGPLTIQQAGEFKDTLMHSMECPELITLNLEKVSEIDISGLQILCSAYRTAVNGNKSMALTGGVPDAVKKAVEDAGFSCRGGCAAGPGKACPWITRRV